MKTSNNTATLIKPSSTQDLCSPKSRGERLRRVRNLANLSRKNFPLHGINLNTLKGWEIGRHGGLTEKGAKKNIKPPVKLRGDMPLSLVT